MIHRSLPRAPLAACVVLATSAVHAAGPQSVVLLPSKDNTLIEIADGSLSSALTEFVFAGRVGSAGAGGKLRRGLMHFDVAAAVPAGATITAVRLDVFCAMSNTGGQPVELHRTLQAWGEGTSFAMGGGGAPATPGDATWLHTFWPEQFWSTAGGSFEPMPSATTTIGAPGAYAWTSTPGMIADIQSWLDDPAGNFGWAITGNEPVAQSVKALASRENAVLEHRPQLTIDFTVKLDPADLNGDGVVDGADLGLLLAAWGTCAERSPRCVGDLDGNGAVDGADLGLLLGAETTP